MKTWTLNTYTPSLLPGWVAENYGNLLPYVKEFLTSKHPHRSGVMCPFAPKAIKDDLIYFSYHDSDSTHEEDVLIDHCLSCFSDNIGTRNGSVIIIFKREFPLERLLDLHIRNKEKCINQWVMLGLLYDTNSASSLHSTEYFPLRTPTPIVVLRNLTISDLIFLDPEHYSKKQRISFLSAFINKFSAGASSFSRKQVEAARSLRAKYRRQTMYKWSFIALSLSAISAAITLGLR